MSSASPPLSDCELTSARLEEAIAQARATGPSRHGMLFVRLSEILCLSSELLEIGLRRYQGIALISHDMLRGMHAVPIPGATDGTSVVVGGVMLLLFDDPWSESAVQVLKRNSRQSARLALAQPGQLARLMQSGMHPTANFESATESLPHGALSGGVVVSFVNSAIERAYVEGASDIHFETDRQGVNVKFRLDGVMTRGERLAEPDRAEEVISRIKVMAQLDITERRRPQDGRIHWKVAGTSDAVDLRVSIMPSIFGEDAVLRLLDKGLLRHSRSDVTLEALGFSESAAHQLRELAQRPHGMLLITGPTGSGKTTTVYAALSQVNDGLEKIITIEDPVEYELPGVLQIPVNEQKGLTFATGLRSILRHDPDKILVGEIRDAETAQIAVQSSLTGHLVFTTVHANSLFDVLGRFQHFGIETFALASALNGVIVQRLLRQACIHCIDWRSPHDDEVIRLEALQLSIPKRLPAPTGCQACRQTGYRGRFVVAEVHTLSDHVRDLMVARASMSELKRAIYRTDGDRLISQALHLVSQGRTTLEEVTRVVGLV